MASSATQISVSTGASVQAPHGKTHNKASQDDAFADMLAASRAPEDTARANPAPSKEKTAAADKADNNTGDKTGNKTDAAETKAADAKENQKTPEDRQTDVPAGVQAQAASDTDTDLAAQDANAGTEVLADALTDAANDNSLADVMPELAQSIQPAPQPLAIPLALPATQNITPDSAQAGADAESAPIAGANPAPAPTPDLQPAIDDGKAEGSAQGTGENQSVADKTARAGADDFRKILEGAGTKTDAAEPAAATPDTFKPAEAPANAAAKPSPELNTITLAAPATPAQANTGADKLVATAQAAPAPHLPQPTPNMEQFAVDVAARSQSGAKQFDIRLDPPELGRVEVRLSIDAHGKAEAHLTADQPQTLELLQKDAPALARALRDAGLNVNQDALNFSLKNQQQQAGGDDSARGGARHGFNGSNTSNEPRIEEAAAYVRRSLGVLDIRV